MPPDLEGLLTACLHEHKVFTENGELGCTCGLMLDRTRVDAPSHHKALQLLPIITQWVTEHDAELMAENERLLELATSLANGEPDALQTFREFMAEQGAS